jgi:hypothetical protein
METVKMHRVKYELTYTKNLGNFENIKIDVGLEADGSGDPSVTFAKVVDWVKENLDKQVSEVVSEIQGE